MGLGGGDRGEEGEGEMQICGQVTGSVLPGCFSTTAELLAPRAYYHHQSGRVGGGGSSDLKWGNSLTYCGGSVAGGCVKVGGHGQVSERKRISCGVSDGLEAAEEAQSNRLMEDGAVMVRDDLDMLLQVKGDLMDVRFLPPLGNSAFCVSVFVLGRAVDDGSSVVERGELRGGRRRQVTWQLTGVNCRFFRKICEGSCCSILGEQSFSRYTLSCSAF